MHTLDKDLAPSSWMICSALDERQGLSTVQGAPVQELVTLTPAGDIWMMLDCDVWRVRTKHDILSTSGELKPVVLMKSSGHTLRTGASTQILY